MKNESLTLDLEHISESTLIDSARAIGPALSQHSNEEEKDRRLSRSSVDLLRKAGLYRLFMPKSLGGIEADPITTAKIVEEISRYNAAAGWSLMVGNTSTWWCSRLSDEGIEEIYENGRDTFIAGAFHPPMKATPAEGGYGSMEELL